VPDRKQRGEYHKYINLILDACDLLDIRVFGTFIGNVPGKDIDEIMEDIEQVFAPILEYAKDRNIKVAIENCPMVGGMGKYRTPYAPGNIAYCPENWDKIFNKLNFDNLGLNLDPSHLCWQNIDYVETTRQYGKRVFHVHAKDLEFVPSRISRTGILHSKSGLGSNTGTWRFRIPGYGQINWAAFISALAESGYDGTVSVEHEDPIFTGLRIEEGLYKAVSYLSQYIIRHKSKYGSFEWFG
jgi:sugar phosphate isomerase/epimerase